MSPLFRITCDEEAIDFLINKQLGHLRETDRCVDVGAAFSRNPEDISRVLRFEIDHGLFLAEEFYVYTTRRDKDKYETRNGFYKVISKVVRHHEDGNVGIKRRLRFYVVTTRPNGSKKNTPTEWIVEEHGLVSQGEDLEPMVLCKFCRALRD